MDWTILLLAVTLWPSSSFWEGVEYFAEAIVITGALVEVLADFEIILKGDDKRELRKRIEKKAAIALVVGLALGLGALVRTNQLFTDTIAMLDREARDANDRAVLAIKRSDKESDTRVAVEEGIAWRRLTKDQQREVASPLAPFKGQVMSIYCTGDSESLSFGWDVGSALHKARWNVSPISPSLMPLASMWEGPFPTGVLVRSSADKNSLDAATALV